MSFKNFKNLTKNLLKWYDKNKSHRQMPWRGEKDPYKIWVSEIMLQQTQVSTVKDYYKRWMKKFPTYIDVAKASQEEVLKQWEGLGYYSRARNFHESCKTLHDNNQEIPSNPEEFLKCKGVGPYISAAV